MTVLVRMLLLAIPLAACRQPVDVLDLDHDREADFHCADRSECWSFADASSAWESEAGSPRSPEIHVDSGAMLVLRMRSVSPVDAHWRSAGGERLLERLTNRKPWTFQLFFVPLPEGEIGSVRLAHGKVDRPRPRRGPEIELNFAEILRPGRGRCYRDHVRANRRLLDAVACVAPAGAELVVPSPDVTAVRVATIATSERTRAALEVRAGSGDRLETLAVLHPTSSEVWREDRLELPADTDRPLRLRFEAQGDSADAVIWSARLVRDGDERPNAIVYLVDTLRADALGTYGARRPTPHFDALARGGVVFDHVLAPGSWTLPSVASLFTGRDIFEHGVVYDRDVLPTELTTVAERFRAAGYTTAAVSASLWVSDRHGTHRGFQELVDVSPARGPRGIAAGTSSADANDWVLPWIERHAGEPFFLYVHVIDPHQPYTPPDELSRAFVKADWPPEDSRWRAARSPSDGRGPRGLSAVERMDPDRSAAIISVARHLYDAAVAHCDRQFGRLIATLERTGLRERTILIVTADHGEEFMEHRLTGHAHSLYAEVTRVPLIVSYPALPQRGVRGAEPVGLVDVASTLLTLAGLPVDESIGGSDLLPLIDSPSRQWSRARPLFLLHRPQQKARPIKGVPEMDAVLDGGWKLIHNRGDAAGRPSYQMFDATVDPGETRNLAAEEPATLTRLRTLLETADRVTPPAPAESAAELDEATRRALRGLGYVD